ncbi:MAG: hypothetical protein AAB393_06930, partial [Bacteroidota bacterium]
MTRYPGILLAVMAAVVIALSGCELDTQTPDFPVINPANHVVINEVFVLPETNQNRFSWIEF